MRFFGIICLVGIILTYISTKTQNLEVGMIGMSMMIFGGFITLVLATKSNKKPEGDPSTKIEIHHHHYDGKKKQ